MEEFTTPMMKQYAAIKKQYTDCLLFYRMGDFYELFLEDALTGAQVLNITLTSRPRGKDGHIPMAGVPYHAVDSYLSKLVKAGYKVAICEQVSLPNKYGIIEREVIRIVTPGTVLDEKALTKKENNYIVSLLIRNNTLAYTTADISTGYFGLTEIQSKNIAQTIKDELARINPSECILPDALYNTPELLKILKYQNNLNIYTFAEWDAYAQNAEQFLKKHFGLATLEGFGVTDKTTSLETAAALLAYLQQTQKSAVGHINKITVTPPDQYMALDKSTIINLELFSTIREHDTRGSLLSVLDQTQTAMGGRLLKQWIRKPLIQKEMIEQRHDAVGTLLTGTTLRRHLREQLQEVSDIERLLSRLSLQLGNPRDLINLKSSLQQILEIKKAVTSPGQKDTLLLETANTIKDELKTIIQLIENNIQPEPPIGLHEGNIIREGIDDELDKLRKIAGGSKDWMQELELQERERTGIGSLKIRFNKVFGFYIEVSKSNLHLVPEDYSRKQTLVNGERFITPELKKHEEIILTAEEKINELEFALYKKILQQVLDRTAIIQEAAQSIAVIDCFTTFAQLAEKNNYVRPELKDDDSLHILNGRHPVVEKLLNADTQFVPNTVTLSDETQQMVLLTGPNMAGKSVFIRQVAVIVLMNQIGCYVPAEKAVLSVVDRIFVRSGASDVITSGLSTFMVEMVETAHILHHATEKSLIIMDEIGRGTSTYDGISIAWAIAQYLVTHFAKPPKTLFATHYHELQSLEQQYPQHIKNYHMAVADDRGEPVFLHTLLPGGASHSFGVAVAKLAGLPQIVLDRAYEMLQTLEFRDVTEKGKTYETVITGDQTQKTETKIPSQFYPQTISIVDHLITKELENLDIHKMTPLEALNTLSELKEKLKLYSAQDKPFIEAD